jgi:hypothetical protein
LPCLSHELSVHVAPEKKQVFSVPDIRSSKSGYGFCRSEATIFLPFCE